MNAQENRAVKIRESRKICTLTFLHSFEMVLVGHVIRELIVGCEIHNFLRNMDCSSAVYSHNRIC